MDDFKPQLEATLQKVIDVEYTHTPEQRAAVAGRAAARGARRLGPAELAAVSADAGPVGKYLAEIADPLDACADTQDAALAELEQRLVEALDDVRALREELRKQP